MKAKKIVRSLIVIVAVMISTSLMMPVTVNAARHKKIKFVSVKIGKRSVGKKTYSLQKGKSVKVKVTAKSASAKKSISYKSNNKKVATVSKKGKITAKKAGTAKITVTIKGKNGKKRTSWVKVKVMSSKGSVSSGDGHKHRWATHYEKQKVKAIDVEAYDEPSEYEGVYLCNGCDYTSKDGMEMIDHSCEFNHNYHTGRIVTGYIHHDEVYHYKTVKKATGKYCVLCGIRRN